MKQRHLWTSPNTNFLHMTVLCWLLMVLWHLTWWKEKSTFAGRLPKHPFWMMGTGNSNCFLCHIVSSILEFSIKVFFNCSVLSYQTHWPSNIDHSWFGSELSINCQSTCPGTQLLNDPLPQWVTQCRTLKKL